MGDTIDEVGFLGRQLLWKSQTNSLRQQMNEFIEQHEHPRDLKQMRREAAGGKEVSEIMTEDREERV
jgi:ribosomal protein S3AE